MEQIDYTIADLIKGHLLGTLSGEEQKKLEKWLDEKPGNRHFFNEFLAGSELSDREAFSRTLESREALRRFEAHIGYNRPRRTLPRWAKYAAVLLIPVASLLFLLPERESESTLSDLITESIPPGSAKAILRFGDRVFELGKREQEIALLPTLTANISPTEIIYDREAAARENLPSELETPRGGEFTVVLPDGSKVYLNSASILRFPAAFETDMREVYLSGEAFFEVSKDSERPFYVVTDNIRVRVYGTSFNINTRRQQGTQAVLVNGEIGIQGKGDAAESRLAPSQLAQFSPDGTLSEIRTVDVLPYVGWKDGQLIFDNEPLEQILNTLSLWYNVDIFYQTQEVRSHRFTGDMKKYDDISVILGALERILDIRFIINDKTITVTHNKTEGAVTPPVHRKSF